MLAQQQAERRHQQVIQKQQAERRHQQVIQKQQRMRQQIQQQQAASLPIPWLMHQ